MINTLIGRKKEQAILKKALVSHESEMVAVFGRRRVGKTFLVRSVYEKKITLEFTGVQNATRQEQIESFHFLLQQIAPDTELSHPKNWLQAFHLLIKVMEAKRIAEHKRIIFFDELPWIATKKSGFLKAFGFFWNNWASKNNVVVVICGSAASWMIQKIVKNKGGLHNRITQRIDLKPFTLAETKAFLSHKGVKFNHYQIILIYMIMGGIPHYLKEIENGKSAIQNIDNICFAENGLLNDEFSNLYPALFEHPEGHIKIIRALAQKWKGMARAELIAKAQLPDGGGTTKILDELIFSGFVSSYYPFGKKRKDRLYRLTDEYSLFYLNFIEQRKRNIQGTWKILSQSATFKSWSGYAFESLCLKHVAWINRALQIAGIYVEASSFLFRGNDNFSGIQIDLLLDRNDEVINLCEIKFQKQAFNISKSYAENLRKKVLTFQEITKTNKQIFLTFITTFGVHQNQYSQELVDNDLTMDIFFSS
ncbi:MAG: ATP-binding protein [Bacteroidota bacterium]